MSPQIRALVRDLYSVEHEWVLAQLGSLLDRSRGKPFRAKGKPFGFNEADSLLITYADQVNREGASPLSTLNRFAETYLRGIISGVHILPFYPWSSDDGFSVKDFYRVEPSYGGWDDILRLGENFDLMFDAVFNHMSAGSDWFQAYLRDVPEFRDFFVSVTGDPCLQQVVRPRALPLLTEFDSASGRRKVWTTFSADQVDLNVANPHVLLALIDALLFYAQTGATYIRLDAIGFLWKEIGTSCIHLPQTHQIIQLFRAILEDLDLGVRLVTETNVPHVDNISYFGNGENEAHVVYNFALPPLVLHSFVSGSAMALSAWAESLSTPSSNTAFLNFLASHDGIGLNPARGILSEAELDALVQRTLAHGGLISYKAMPDGSSIPYEMNINFLDALSSPGNAEPDDYAVRKFLTAQAIMLSLRGIPGIYFHSLFGSRGDPESATRTGIPRRINRQKVTWSEMERDLGNPESLRFQVFEGFRTLLQVRRGHAAFSPSTPQQVIQLDPRLFTVVRQAQGSSAIFYCLHNVSDTVVRVENTNLPLPCIELQPFATRWLEVPTATSSSGGRVESVKVHVPGAKRI